MDENVIPSRPETLEVTPARDSDEFLGLWARGIREASDPILRGHGGDLRFYDHVRTDGQVWSTLQQRREAVASRKWEVHPGAEDAASEEAADRLEAELRALDWHEKTRRMLWGVFYGYSVAEIMWRPEGNRWSFGDIRVRRARRFGFDVDGNLMLRPALSRPEQRMPEGKFWVMTTGTDTDDEPYGLGLAHLLYWPVYFKRHGLKAWMVALDKFSSPTAYGKYPPGTTDQDKARLLAGLLAIRQDSALIVPDGMDVGYLQTGKSVSLDYAAFDKRMDGWISKVVLSQTMTTDDGSSRSQAETHMDVRDEVAASDAHLLDGSFNAGPVTWWTHWNFGDSVAPPRVVRVMEDAEDLDAAAQRDAALYAIGWEPTEERIEQVYGEGYVRRAAPSAPPSREDAPPADLAEAEEPDAIGRFVDELIGSGAAPEAAADMLAPVVDALAGASSFAEARAALDALALSDEALEPLREHLSEAAFAARLGGEVGAQLRGDVEVETP